MSPPADAHPATGETGHKTSRAQTTSVSSIPDTARPRRPTVLSDIQDTISHPGNVRINVQGAFIVDEEQPSTPKSEDYEHDPKDIRLPNHTAVVSHVAVDIGGSLAKLVYFSREHGDDSGGRLNFLKFETDRIDTCIEFMRKLKDDHKQNNGSARGELCVMATGGGAFKYYDRITEALGVEVTREDEMECLIIGLDFFINEIPTEVFTYSEDIPMSFVPFPPDPPNIYPYLLVNIGSGVSMIKVSGPRQYERIGGTSLGGGTLWGLLSMLTGARTFDDMLRLAEKGDNSTVDLLVGDIYGQAYNKIGLKSTHIASSFGKVYKMKRAAERDAEDGCSGDMKNREEAEHVEGSSELPHEPATFRPEDISRSLLYAVSNNIGQIAYLHAEKHGLERIYFGGSFIGGHSQTMNTLSYAIRFWSKGTKQAYFLRHEGYLGSVGAFLKRQPRNWGRRASLDGPRGAA
ncbi:fumble-domain-containing protein [Dothidotthia symphoricarpi CBS 119687]|uniref:Fumble-domain-containing protein n=1 Tax=Dothidotthia symphoricarpi CBS 119687 TaxID=1392245 RepID=A0A6A6AQW3_9PLEO|nr:fumble-domain-containing protein [Dothidotthia symphoricarpi CBS 119687]KAF2133395.1 fumble-domain-containing protein [Dothidotthia symphoricarpi CBS 119687]